MDFPKNLSTYFREIKKQNDQLTRLLKEKSL